MLWTSVGSQVAILSIFAVCSQAFVGLASLIAAKTLLPESWGWVMYMLTVQGFMHTFASQSLRNKTICLIGGAPQITAKVAASVFVVSAFISSLVATAGSAVLLLVQADSARVQVGLAILWGGVINCLSPVFLWEAKCQPRFVSLVNVCADAIFFIGIVVLVFKDLLTPLLFVAVLAGRWLCQTVCLWFPLWQEYRKGALTASRTIVQQLVASVPHQASTHLLVHLPISASLLAASWVVTWGDTGLLSIIVMVQQVYVLLAFQLHRTIQPFLANRAISKRSHTRFPWIVLSYSLLLALVMMIIGVFGIPWILNSPYAGIPAMLPLGLAVAFLVSCNQMRAFQWTLAANERRLLIYSILSAAVLGAGYALSGYFQSIISIQIASFLGALVGAILLSMNRR